MATWYPKFNSPLQMEPQFTATSLYSARYTAPIGCILRTISVESVSYINLVCYVMVSVCGVHARVVSFYSRLFS